MRKGDRPPKAPPGRRQETGHRRQQAGSRIFFAALLAAVVCIHTSVSFAQSKVRIEDAYVRTAAQLMTSAAYFKIVNNSAFADTLYDVEAPFAEMSHLHETYTENSMTGMRSVARIIIAAHSDFELKPGSYHVMLMNVKKELKAGEKVQFKLYFKRSGVIRVKAVVQK